LGTESVWLGIHGGGWETTKNVIENAMVSQNYIKVTFPTLQYKTTTGNTSQKLPWVRSHLKIAVLHTGYSGKSLVTTFHSMTIFHLAGIKLAA